MEEAPLSPYVGDDPFIDDTTKADDSPLRYGVRDRPPIVLTVILALQTLVLSLGTNLLMSITLADLACADRNDPIRAKLFCTSVFMVGLTTVVQSAIGIRLPMFQGVSAAFLGPLLSMRTAGIWSCDVTSDVDLGTESNSTGLPMLQNVSMETKQEMVNYRLTQLQGSLMLSGLVTEVFLGGTGLLGYLVKLVGPITVCVTITSIGLSLYPLTIFYSSTYLPVSLSASILMVLCTMYLSRIYVPIPRVNCTKRNSVDELEHSKRTKLPFFRIFAYITTVVVSWALCWILTFADVFSNDPSDPTYRARTDTRADMINLSPWFMFPYPGQFGPLRFNTAVFIGFVSAYLSSTVESIGDYMATSRATETFPPPRHAINRGILIEGIMGMLAGTFGTGHATTSYSTNIVMIKLTQVASRSVTVLAGVFCMFFGIFSKLGALLASIPDPVIGGVAIINFGLLTSFGLSSLQKVNLSSTRNLAVLGTSLYVGLFTSELMKLKRDSIITGIASLDQVIKLILGTQMFMAGITSIILDNTVKGSKEDRGTDEMSSSKTGSGNQTDKHNYVYNVPGISKLQRKVPCLRHIPFLQAYRPKTINTSA